MRIDPADKLDVFVSSDQKEFERKRKRLSAMINKVPVLKCSLLEDRGADSNDVRTLSVQAAEACDVYIGIFGKAYSDLTILECRTAIKERKRYLVYVQMRTKSLREPALDNFIKEELEFLAKYHRFKTCKELEKQIMKDLSKQVGKILRTGSETLSQVKEEAKSIEQNVKTQFAKPSASSEIKLESLLSMAEDYYRRGDYLSSLISANIYLEKILRYTLSSKTDKDYAKRPFHFLLKEASDLGIIDGHSKESLLRYRDIRNKAVHDGISPPSEDARTIINLTKRIADQLQSLINNSMRRS